ncbi:MAG TPA: hypothetical protein V6D29_24960 [Leptolyngbyaceae cyanobacterium]
MGIKTFAHTLYAPEDALDLRQGKLRSYNAFGEAILHKRNVLAAAEVLIILNDANNLCSRADVIERALSYGWEPFHVARQCPLLVPSNSKHRPISKQIGRLGRDFWRNLLRRAIKFLLKMVSRA